MDALKLHSLTNDLLKVDSISFYTYGGKLYCRVSKDGLTFDNWNKEEIETLTQYLNHAVKTVTYDLLKYLQVSIKEELKD